MAKELIFYTNPQSRGNTVQWMLEEVSVPYRTEVLDYGTTMKSPEYLAINPMGKVPAIKHGDTVVTESAAICVYLAETFPEAGLAPTVDERGAYYRWLFFTASCVEQAWSNQAAGFIPKVEQQRMFGYGSYELTMNALSQAVKGRRYIAGNRFTAADVYIGRNVWFGIQFGKLSEYPDLVAYWEGLKDRPALLRSDEKIAQLLRDAETKK